MARVFLSYDREDAARARIIALALEKAGHTVWWDKIIRAGAQYGNEIEQALKDSDAVVVLWSKRSVDSAWVRDEAAAGRDSGRLVPVLLDASDPPMGFRQFQNIDLSRWKGRGRPPQLQALLDAVGDAGPAIGGDHAVAKAMPRSVNMPGGRLLLVAVVAAAILIAGLLLWRTSEGRARVPLVAVTAADQSVGAKAWSRDLLVKLGSLETANTDALRLVDKSGDARPDLTFEVSGAMRPENPEANLLLRGKDRAVLWSKDFQEPGTKLADLKQQLAYTAAQVLRCAVEGLNAGGKPLDQQVLKLYLKGCSALAATPGGFKLRPIFLEVTRKAPSFGGAWAKLLKIEAWNAAWGPDRRAILPSLKRHFAEARKVNAHMAEVYIAQAEILPGNPLIESMQLLDQAVEYNPESPEALFQRSMLLRAVGRMDDALADARRAAELDPLSPALRNNFIQFLALSGATTAALNEVAIAERLWPGASNLAATRFWIQGNFGDPRELWRTFQSKFPEHEPYRGAEAFRSFLKAKIEPSARNIDRAIAEQRAVSETSVGVGFLQTLAKFGRDDELFRRLMQSRSDDARRIRVHIFQPEFDDFWRNPRSMQVAAKLGLIDYWRKSGKWPDFCSDAPYDCKAEAAKRIGD